MLDLTALVDLAKSKGYQPFYDEGRESLKLLLEELEKVKFKPIVLMPGNDLYSHALEVERNGHVFQVMIRFDLRMFIVVVYLKSGTARYAVPYEEKFKSILKPLLDILFREGFQEIGAEFASISIGDETLAQGMMGNTLFAFYFEDG